MTADTPARGFEKRILVVDDDDAIRALLFTVLRRRGFKVDQARNGAEALDRLSRCRYALVLLDLMMPQVSGYEVLDELAGRASGFRPLILILTAGTEPRDLPPDLVVGAIRKPFDIELLAETVSACMTTLVSLPQGDDCPRPESDLPRTGPFQRGH